ncbi:MAG: transglutaminase family protein [Verrucomicrobia bacterium]|nr:MAG: transglutaminase family protein [Verrucomicrobiota bacterium]
MIFTDNASTGSKELPWTEPLLLNISHLTRYTYEGHVKDSFNEARLQPVSDSLQQCRDFHFKINPNSPVRDYPDFYANCVHYFDVPEPHESLEVQAISSVQTLPESRGPIPVAGPDAISASPMKEQFFDFLHSSEFVSLEADVWREAVDALPSGVTDIWPDTVAIGEHIHRNYKYTPLSTNVNTRAVEVVKKKQGVCQDFAHLMLGLCRTHGIPARYVSGYFLNKNRLPGEIEASHAWLEVFIPGYGWKGYDPTHRRETDTRYVKLAVGRDYSDIRPVGGTFRGKGTRKMVVEVTVDRVV